MDIIAPKFPPVRKPINEKFCGWIGQAAPGDTLEYYRGFLALVTHSRTDRACVSVTAWN